VKVSSHPAQVAAAKKVKEFSLSNYRNFRKVPNKKKIYSLLKFPWKTKHLFFYLFFSIAAKRK